MEPELVTPPAYFDAAAPFATSYAEAVADMAAAERVEADLFAMETPLRLDEFEAHMEAIAAANAEYRRRRDHAESLKPVETDERDFARAWGRAIVAHHCPEARRHHGPARSVPNRGRSRERSHGATRTRGSRRCTSRSSSDDPDGEPERPARPRRDEVVARPGARP